MKFKIFETYTFDWIHHDSGYFVRGTENPNISSPVDFVAWHRFQHGAENQLPLPWKAHANAGDLLGAALSEVSWMY